MSKLVAKINAELGKKETDMQTWNLVQEFWNDGTEWPNAILQITLDRVRLLEARMERQHGWRR